MKLETFKEDLRQAISSAERITNKTLSLPALGYLMLEAAERNLLVKSTNLDLGVEIAVPAKVSEGGKIMVSGAVLSNFLSNLTKDEKVVLESNLNTLSITTTHTKSVFNTYPTEDFPSLPRVVESDPRVKLPLKQFLAGIKAVSYAASTSDIKPEIASVYIYQDQGDLVFVATDSFRLAEKRVVLEGKIKEPISLIIPIRNALEITRALETGTGDVTLSFASDQVSLETDRAYLTSRLVDGVFPDYRQIMPTKSETEVVVLRNDLVNTLKLANVFSDKLSQITLKVVVKDGLFELFSRNTEVGEVASSLEATLGGEDVEASYNVRFILDGFASISSDSINLRFNSRNRPLWVGGVNDPSFVYLVMPLNR